MLRTALAALAIVLCTSCTTAPTESLRPSVESAGNISAEPGTPQDLLNRMVGDWVLEGVIAGETSTHDVNAAWVLQHNYVRITEVSRERDAAGRPQYEAVIYIGWLDSAGRVVCYWFDNTEVATPGVTCSAAQAGDTIPFEFRDVQGGLIFFNTFTYDRNADTWQWNLENLRGEERETFGLVTLRRR